MDDFADLIIIGGGAAGLAAGIFAGEVKPHDFRVVILDGARQLGAKILVSGGGRCNVTHDVVSPDDYNGSRNVVRNILAAFDVRATIDWFASMGVELKREETGKLFPVSDSAKSVLNALLQRSAEVGAEILTQARASRVRVVDQGRARFEVIHSQGTLRCSRVIICTGGRSLPRTGSDGVGWEILKELGHTVTPTYAALVPLVLDAKMFHPELAGIAQDVELSTFVANKRIDVRVGSLLWTHFGISGPVVMDASRHWVIAHETGQGPKMMCNFFPKEDFEKVENWLIDSAAARPRAAMSTHLSSRLPERVAEALLRHVKIDPRAPAAQLSRDARRALVHALTALPLPVVGHRGWNYAEVTAGGVPLNEIDFRTMQSRKMPGLYLAGEALDCDGRIGGFNFQWAWATGYLAGKRAAMKSENERESP